MALRNLDNVAGLSDEVAGSLAPLRQVDEGVLAGGSNPISKWYIERSPIGNMVNQELEMSCVPAVCRQMLRDLFAEVGLSVDVDEALLREGMGTSVRGTQFTDPKVVETLQQMIDGTWLENSIRFESGYMPIEDGIPFEMQHLESMLSDTDSMIVQLADLGDRHAVIIDDIDITRGNVIVRDPGGIQGAGVSGIGNIGVLEWDIFIKLWEQGQYAVLISTH